MEEKSYQIALAGNPNVGKSTVFNALTGMHQHTGNWAGKTVEQAKGMFMFHMKHFELIDLPGTYSLHSVSAEERAALEYFFKTPPDAVIVVCDACCVERNLPLALEAAELCPCVIVCVNLMDEAKQKGIQIDMETLQNELQMPVVGICARAGEGLDGLLEALEHVLEAPQANIPVHYEADIEARLQILTDMLKEQSVGFAARGTALRLLAEESDVGTWLKMEEMPPHITTHLQELLANLKKNGWDQECIQDSITLSIMERADQIAAKAVRIPPESDRKDRILDDIFLGKYGGIVMLLLLCFVLWLTILGTNVPSAMLESLFSVIGNKLRDILSTLHTPEALTGFLIDGIYHTTAWVVSVMLPPMAVFFPFFTLLEDAGYLPRAAFLLDKPLRNSGACGKQALTMCMGLGCNACGVTGCRIIDSPRERLIAVLTNVFMPCNGRFPMLIFLAGMLISGKNVPMQAGITALVIAAGAGITCAVSAFLSKTLLRGEKSAFLLELPPYRKPQIGKTFVRSLLDRTIFVLGRAAAVAAPAGAVIWLASNLQTESGSLLQCIADFLDPAAKWLGMDGMILLAFLLGLPANETVMPMILTGYLSQSAMIGTEETAAMREILT
ncbi:MAG: ferrous iron transport protein B, partial [Oscillospiraceae bacterium]|nr:ferrous iron transport protein B [Oscillospiraceae bacterium]